MFRHSQIVTKKFSPLGKLELNPACGGTFFTVRYIIAKIVKFCDLNRTAVARALGRARAMAISMARGGDGKHTQDAPARALVGSFDRFTSIETNEGVQDPSGLLSGEGPASATFFGCPRRPKCRGTIGRGQNERCAPFAVQILW